MALAQGSTSSALASSPSPAFLPFHRSQSRVSAAGFSYRTRFRPGLSQPALRSAQEDVYRDQVGPGREPSQCLHRSSSLQNDDGGSGSPYPSTRLLAGQPGSEGCLLARAYSSPVPPLPGFHSSGPGVPVPCSTLRPQHRAQGVYEVAAASEVHPVRTWGASPDVPGRLARHRPVAGGLFIHASRHHGGGVRHGPGLQSPEVSPSPISTSSVARAHLGHDVLHGVSLAYQSAQVLEEGVPSCSVGVPYPEAVGESSGLPQPRIGGGSVREAACTPVDPGGPSGLLVSRQRSSCAVSKEDSVPSPVVDFEATSLLRFSMGAPASESDLDDGRFGLGLGLPDIRGSPGLGSLAPALGPSSHQREGASSHHHRSPTGTHSGRHLHPGPVGQSGDGALHQQIGVVEIHHPPLRFRGPLQSGAFEISSHLSVPHRGGAESVGRRFVPSRVVFGRVGSGAGCVHSPDDVVRPASSGPICLRLQPSLGPLPDALFVDPRRGSRRFPRRLEQVAVHLPVSSPPDFHHAPGPASPEVLQGQGPSRGSSVGGSALGARVTELVSPSSSSPRGSSSGSVLGPFSGVLEASRLEFLHDALSRSLSAVAVEDVLRGHADSTKRQYQSCWEKFQQFIRDSPPSHLSSSVFIQFGSYLFHEVGLLPSTISCHLSAILDPLRFAYNIVPDDRTLELLRRSFFKQRPPRRRCAPEWSLHKVLALLSSDRFSSSPSQLDRLFKAVFLLSLASGLRCSQLAALSRSPSLTSFKSSDSSVSLVPHPTFIAKNERVDHVLGPVVVPAWFSDGSPHLLCPVAALREYVSSTPADPSSPLWLWPDTLSPLKTSQVASVICKVIELADPGRSPTAHQVRSYASTLAFLRSCNIERVRLAGQWSSYSSFLSRYLSPLLQDSPCVAMSSLP